jgi:lysophospholipase L1-like esterase
VLAVAGCGGWTPSHSAPAGRPVQLPADRAAVVVYVALGDSTVEGHGATAPGRNYVGRLYARLRTVYPRAQLANLGVGGATAADVLRGQLPQALALRPALVTLSVGPNDITQDRSLWAFARDVALILDALARDTTAVVVVNLIPDMTVTPRFRGTEAEARIHDRVVAWNDVLAAQARKHGAEIVDLYAASRREVPGRPELISTDGYHPSDAGYARWAELMWAGVDARIPR